MEFLIFQMILYFHLLYLNYLLFDKINNLNTQLSKYDKIINDSEMKINRISNILFRIHKKNIELTDIKLEELEENIIKKMKIS